VTLLSPSFCTITITSHTSLKAMVKLDQLRFELVAHSPYSPDLAPSDYYLFPNLKRWLQGKRSNEEVIAETEAYFEGLNVSYYRKGFEMLENPLYQVYRSRRQLCWGINITLPKKRLFSLKIPGLFSPCSIYNTLLYSIMTNTKRVHTFNHQLLHPCLSPGAARLLLLSRIFVNRNTFLKSSLWIFFRQFFKGNPSFIKSKH